MVVGDVTTAVDVLVLGAGPGGYAAAIRAAQLGRHVTIVEPGPAGGVCLNRGCIPLKALLSASERYQQARQEELAQMGIRAESVSFNWSEMQAWKQSVVDRLSNGVRQLISGNRIEAVTGNGWFINEQEVRVEGEHGSHRFKFEQCILAVGASAAPVAGIDYDGKQILTPEQALRLSELPATLSIAGNDYIALELATIFARLGVKVRLLLPGERLLDGVDPAALRLVQAGLRKLGVQVVTKVKLAEVSERPLVLSAGVRPNTAGLHLDAVAVQLNERAGIAVNTMQQSTVERIYAVGDCTGGQALGSIALKQGKLAAEVGAGQRVQFAPLVTPLIVHTTPEIATVGLSAEQAKGAGYQVVQGRFPLAANGRALTLGSDNGVALVVASQEDGVVLGATLVGPRAGDIIGQAALAIEMGATLTDLAEILYAHPGLSETLQESAENALGKAIHILTKN
ncbi:FAD-dependent oxidoreductase [Ktedonosporobacter rubrisoli]|uniref:Dihydrolipoyl dehydrogenase n=1 Tax=Ktedonosporobacter rubrisoli TaxID=2509675 RepID=A0A4P6JVE0_KTERU|nr:FAD-dependent oxidoreductase [Ktedonosporobacter rubrisoli]QBD79333.1 FAD-dependent oxidoreductase [Ktedonosporobacter rubrisoli]